MPKATTSLKCKNCDKPVRILIVITEGKPTADLKAVHSREYKQGPFLRTSTIERTTKTELVNELAAECKAASVS